MRQLFFLALGFAISLSQFSVLAEDTTLSQSQKDLIHKEVQRLLSEKQGFRLGKLPGNLTFSGWVLSEWEDSDNLGSDGSRVTTTAFDSSDNSDRVNEAYTFGNLEFLWEFEQSKLNLIIEFGEYAAGLTDSSGQLGSDVSDIEVKNFFIEHDFENGWGLSAGIQGIVADPRGMIMDDDQTALTLSYQLNDNTKFWSYVAETNTGTSRRQTDDQSFYGLNAELSLDGSTLTPFYIHMKDRSTANTDTVIDFYGLHSAMSFDTWDLEGQYAYNSGSSNSSGLSGNLNTSMRGQGVQLKITKNLDNKFIKAIGTEVIHTSGGRPKVATPTGNGRQQHFQSQDPQVAYSMNIADSDGSDLSPGSARLVPIHLALPEGLNIVVVAVDWQFDEKLSGYVRHAWLRTDVSNPITGTGNKNIGTEIDAGLSYVLGENLKFKLDYGYLKTGAYFAMHSDAHLFTSGLLLEF